MIIDPYVAVIQVAEERGPDFYAGVMRRVAARRDQPRGVMMHFTTLWHGAFIVGTVYRDIASMTESFVGFTAPESQNEMVETGRPLDLYRDEFRLERLFVEPDVEAQPFAYVPAGGIIAFTTDSIMPKVDTYRTIARQSGYFDEPADGRIAHIAHDSPAGVRSMTFWRSREQGERWYEQHLFGPLAELEPDKATPEALEAAWLELNTFVISVGPEDPSRNFVREVAGPSTV